MCVYIYTHMLTYGIKTYFHVHMNLYRETSLYIHTIHASHLKITPLFLETRKEPLCLMWLRPPASHEGFPPFEQLALCQRHKACTRRLSWGVEYDCCQVLTSSSGSTCCFLVFFFATVVCSHTKIISCDKEISTMHMFIQKQDEVKIDHIWNNSISNLSVHIMFPYQCFNDAQFLRALVKS